LPTLAGSKTYQDYCQAIEHPQMSFLEFHKATGLSRTTISKRLKEIDPTLLSKTKVGRECIYTLLSTARARELTRFTVVGRRKRRQVARMLRLGLDPDWIWPRRGRKPKMPTMDPDARMMERLRKLTDGELRYLDKQAPGFKLVPNKSQGEILIFGYPGRRIEEIKRMIPKAEAHYRSLLRLKHPPAWDADDPAAWEPDDESISGPNFEESMAPSIEEKCLRSEEDASSQAATEPYQPRPQRSMGPSAGSGQRTTTHAKSQTKD